MAQRCKFGVCCMGGSKSGLRGGGPGGQEESREHCYAREDQRQGHRDEGEEEVLEAAGRGQVPGKGHSLLCPLSTGSNQRGDLNHLESY